jgi:general secretion pathway protein G
MKATAGVLVLTVMAGGVYLFRDLLGLVPRGTVYNPLIGEFNALAASLKTYKLNAGFYPTTQQGLEALVHKPDTNPIPGRWTKIADRVPTDPWNNPYQYRKLPEDDERIFELFSAGKDGLLGTKDDLSSLKLE